MGRGTDRGVGGRAGWLGFTFLPGIVLAVALIGAAPGLASPAQIKAAAQGYAFVDGPFEQPRGEVADFINPTDAEAPHNVESTDLGPDGLPLFYSRTIRSGETVKVRGTQYLETGRYPFVCTLHASTMTGELDVTDAGVTVKRPSVRLNIPARQIRTVVRKRVVRVEVSSPTGVSAGSLLLRLGRTTIGRPVSLRLAPGGRLLAKVKVPARVAKSLRGKRSAIVNAQADVPFGSTARTKKVIR